MSPGRCVFSFNLTVFEKSTQGLLLTKGDNWGGCLVLDDGFVGDEPPESVFSGSTSLDKPSPQPYPQPVQLQFASPLGPLPPSLSGLTRDQIVRYLAGFPNEVLQQALRRRMQLDQESAPQSVPPILSSVSNPSTSSKGKRKATSEPEDSGPSKRASSLPQIFSRQSGKPFNFFVQGDLGNRTKIVNLITVRAFLNTLPTLMAFSSTAEK